MPTAIQTAERPLYRTQFKPPVQARPQVKKGGLTVLIPAYNEAGSIADTIASLRRQTVPVEEIIVIDDVSTDNTAEVAGTLGVTVVRPPRNTGSKAGAQNYGLQFVATEFTMALDADTTLAPDAIEKLLPAFQDPEVAAACGFVVPRHVKTLWERGRYVEYLYAFIFCKPIQDYFEKPLISSGCFSVYRTEVLNENGGWQTRTLAEDMDLTWSYYRQGYKIRFITEAVCYPIEPHNFTFMSKQLKRWSHGFVQNTLLHWRGLRSIPYLNTMIAIALWDASMASIVYLFLLPVLTLIFLNPLFMLGYAIDIPAVIVPTAYVAWRRNELLLLLTSLPAFFVLRTVNGIFMLEALWSELILRRSFKTYEKGH